MESQHFHHIFQKKKSNNPSFHIPSGTHVSEPLIITPEESTHIMITMEDNAEAIVVVLTSSAAQIPLIIDQESIIGRGAKLHTCIVSANTSELTHTVTNNIDGEDSESTVDWIVYGKDHDTMRLSVCNRFTAPRGRGEMTIKGIAQDHARIMCNGMIDIGEKAGETNAYLSEHLLMLDATAKVDAIPALEIKTNDVLASHSATVTKVSDEDLFYFGSRGIGVGEARTMFVEGFLGEIVERFPDSLHKEVMSSIRRNKTETQSQR